MAELRVILLLLLTVDSLEIRHIKFGTEVRGS